MAPASPFWTGKAAADAQDDAADAVSCSSAWTVSSSASSWRSSGRPKAAAAAAAVAVQQGLRFQGGIHVEHSSHFHFGNTLHYHGPVTLRLDDPKLLDGLPLALAGRPGRRSAASPLATLKTFLRWPRVVLPVALLAVVLAALFACLLVGYGRGYFDPEVPANVTLVTRQQWGAQKEVQPAAALADPVDLVLVHDSDSAASCFNVTECASQLAEMQRLHIRNGWVDIAYNFLVGGDGRVYEGRGWGRAGAHCARWNDRALGVALVGAFSFDAPPGGQLAALDRFLQWGVQQGRIQRRYRLAGKCQLKSAPGPGPWVMAHLKRSPHWWRHTEGDYSCA